MEGGDLSAYLNKRQFKKEGMPIDQVIDFTEQILLALDFIHTKGYLHRDIKPSNILLSEESIGNGHSGKKRIKIADFGLSRAVSFPTKRMTKEIQTLHYRAPEVVLDNLAYSFSVDMWSMGVMIY